MGPSGSFSDVSPLISHSLIAVWMPWAEQSLIFAVQSKFKLRKVDEKKIRVSTGCILSVGTVPMGCILIQIQRFMLYQDSIHPPSFSVFYLPITLGNKIKKKRYPEYFTWFRYIRDHRCLNENPEVQKFKSVSGNLRIGPKTFCKNTEVRLEKNWGFAQTDFSAILCSQNHIFSKDKIFLILHQS